MLEQVRQVAEQTFGPHVFPLRHADPKMTSRYVERATAAALIDVGECMNPSPENAEPEA